MKAVVLEAPFKVVVSDVPKPVLQSDGDVLIEVHYAGLCGTSVKVVSCLSDTDTVTDTETSTDFNAGSDLHHYRGHDEGVGYIMGHEVLGKVVDVGKDVKGFKEGDLVVSPFSMSCGTSIHPFFPLSAPV